MAKQKVYVEPETVLLLIKTWNTTHSLAKCVRETGITRSAAITQLRDSGTITQEECLKLRGHLKSKDKGDTQTSTKEEKSKKNPNKIEKKVSKVDIDSKKRTRKSTETNTHKDNKEVAQGNEPKRRGVPKSSKNKVQEPEVQVVKRGRPKGSKNKPKEQVKTETVRAKVQEGTPVATKTEIQQVTSKYKRTQKKSSDVIQIDKVKETVKKPIESKMTQKVKPNKVVKATVTEKIPKVDIQTEKKIEKSIFREDTIYKTREQAKKDIAKKVTEFNPNKSTSSAKKSIKIEKGGVTIDLESVKKGRKPRVSKDEIKDKTDYLDYKYGKGNWHIMSKEEAVERLMYIAEVKGLIPETVDVLEG